jgi:hypothetical protein
MTTVVWLADFSAAANALYLCLPLLSSASPRMVAWHGPGLKRHGRAGAVHPGEDAATVKGFISRPNRPRDGRARDFVLCLWQRGTGHALALSSRRQWAAAGGSKLAVGG